MNEINLISIQFDMILLEFKNITYNYKNHFIKNKYICKKRNNQAIASTDCSLILKFFPAFCRKNCTLRSMKTQCFNLSKQISSTYNIFPTTTKSTHQSNLLAIYNSHMMIHSKILFEAQILLRLLIINFFLNWNKKKSMLSLELELNLTHHLGK